MTSEERFRSWINKRYSGAAIDTSWYQTTKAAWIEATKQAYEDGINILALSRSEALLMAGEMTAQEWRTVSAILVALQTKLRARLREQT